MSPGPMSGRWAVAAGLVVAAALVWALSPFASSDPDGLERVASTHGLESEVRPHDLEASPVAGYQVRGVASEAFGSGVSGLVGIALTFLVGVGVSAGAVWLSRRRSDGSGVVTTAAGAPDPHARAGRELDDSPSATTSRVGRFCSRVGGPG
ncbi:MAG: PDGLE domain-containing protein [Microthrixaceae bacterium]